MLAWILRDGDIFKADLVPGSTNIQTCVLVWRSQTPALRETTCVPHVSLFCACCLVWRDHARLLAACLIMFFADTLGRPANSHRFSLSLTVFCLSRIFI